MTTSHCLLGNISKIYIASAQTPIFRLLRIYDFATAHLQLFMNCKLKNCFTTGIRLHNWSLCIENSYDNFKSPIWKTFPTYIRLLRKAQFFGYCTSYIHFPNAYLPIFFVYCKSTKNFTNGNHPNICLFCIEKLYKNFKSPIWKHIDDSYRYCAKPNFLATAYLLFSYCECPYYFIIIMFLKV